MSLKNTIDQIANILDVTTLPFLENNTRVYDCFKCKTIVQFPVQNEHGKLFCFVCFKICSDDHFGDVYFDWRIHIAAAHIGGTRLAIPVP